MKKKISNLIEKKKKLLNTQKEKLEEKQKEKKIITLPASSEKKNFFIQDFNNQKSKKNNILTEINASTLSRKKSEQKYKIAQKLFEEKISKKEGLRLFSHSPGKLQVSSARKPRTMGQKNLTETKFRPYNKYDYSRVSNNLKAPHQNTVFPKNVNLNKKESKSKVKKEEQKNEEQKVEEVNPTRIPDENYDPNLYGFNLYKNVKENLKNKDKLCKDELTKESYYCLDCKLSTCKKCSNFDSHKAHTLIPKYIYYSYDEKNVQDIFNPIDSLLEESPDYIHNKILKENLKKTVNDSINQLINRLNDIKNQKLKELDTLFEKSDGCLDTLKEKEKTIKNDIKNYLEKPKDFYFLEVEGVPQLHVNNPDHSGMIESNKDTYNSIFLINYDIFKNTAFINNEIRNLMKNIESNKEKYLTEFNLGLNQINEDVDKFSKEFKGIFHFPFLKTDFYKMVNDKLKKYDEQNCGMKKYVFDNVNKDGNFDKIDKDSRAMETQVRQYLDNILHYQLSDKDDQSNNNSKSLKGSNNFQKLSTLLNFGLAVEKLRNNLKNSGCLNKNKDGLIYGNPDDVKLDKEVLQKYFAYETYNTVHNNFRYKKPKTEMEEIEEEFDEDTEVAKPIPGTNEIQLYDKKTTTLTKKFVKFDKKIHKYTYFLNGCRSVLVKDLLYILGGADKEKNPTKIAYTYNIKTNELKLMPQMINPHSYHSVQFLNFYKSIIVVGGENCSSCEIYDLNLGKWNSLPDLNIPRAHSNLYLDKYTHAIYSFFGIIGDITEKNNYIDVIECLDLKMLALGWCKVEYNNKAEMDFKSGYNKLLPVSPEMILFYGAQNLRNLVKKAAIYIIPKFEMVKIDNKIYAEIQEASKKSLKLSKILSIYV